MKIEPAMDLQELAERMGSEATITEAEAMRNQLLSYGYRGQDTRRLLASRFRTRYTEGDE